MGLEVLDYNEGGEGLYAPLSDGPGALHIEVQKVAHPSRVHLDIETDDIEAEVSRLEKLGAKRIEFVREDLYRVSGARCRVDLALVSVPPPPGLVGGLQFEMRIADRGCS